MTKIERWQEWAKQYKDLKGKLDVSTYQDFFTNNFTDTKLGHVKYNQHEDTIIISTTGFGGTNRSEISMPVYAGKELLSVLKQLY